jgi:hypothetical protein
MKSPIVRITLFLLLTAVFVSGLIAYSHSRSIGLQLPADEKNEFSLSEENSKRYEKQFSVTRGGLVIVEADAGSIYLTSWDKNEVSIVVEVEGNDSRVEKYVVDFSQDGNTVKVVGKVRDRSFFKWHVGSLEARYTINVPREFNSRVNTSGGDIELKEITGTADLKTSGGDITLYHINGESNLVTSGGDIEAKEVVGNVDAETSGGDVICENITGDVFGSTSGGDVEMRNVNGRVKAETSGGSIAIRVSGQNQGIDASTSGGNISIFIPEDVKATIDAETTGGSVECDLPVTVKGKVRDSELHGTINGGGNVIRAGTSGGSITISGLK